jgi:hypothetical protein
MEKRLTGGRRVASLVWPAVLLVAGVSAGLWLALGPGGAQDLPAAVLLAVSVLLGTVWLVRYRATRRLHAALEAYAEMDLARARRHKALRRLRTTSRRRGVLQSH